MLSSDFYETSRIGREIVRGLLARPPVKGCLAKSPVMPPDEYKPSRDKIKPPQKPAFVAQLYRGNGGGPCYTDEHLRMKPVIDVVRHMPFCSPISAGFSLNIAQGIPVTWKWDEQDERIIGLTVRLRLGNEPEAERLIRYIFRMAGKTLPEIEYIYAS